MCQESKLVQTGKLVVRFRVGGCLGRRKGDIGLRRRKEGSIRSENRVEDCVRGEGKRVGS